VPTVAELGYKDFEVDTWFASFAAGQPPAMVSSQFNAEVSGALGARDMIERFEVLWLDAQRWAPADAAPIRRRRGQYVGKLVKDIGVKVDRHAVAAVWV